MKLKGIATILLSFGIASVYAGTANPGKLSQGQVEHISQQVAKQFVLDHPSVNYSDIQQEVLQTLKDPSSNGACCMAWYYGKQVHGGMMAAHGHAVCIPFNSCA